MITDLFPAFLPAREARPTNVATIVYSLVSCIFLNVRTFFAIGVLVFPSPLTTCGGAHGTNWLRGCAPPAAAKEGLKKKAPARQVVNELIALLWVCGEFYCRSLALYTTSRGL